MLLVLRGVRADTRLRHAVVDLFLGELLHGVLSHHLHLAILVALLMLLLALACLMSFSSFFYFRCASK